MKKVIITGAGGFIGGALTKHLLDKGVRVYGVDVSEQMLLRFMEEEGFTPVIAEFSAYSKLTELIGEDNFDAFYHFAWKGYGKDTQSFYIQNENVAGVYEACVAAANLKCKKFVLACSSYEYQKSNINGKIGNCSIYGAAKTAAKSYAKVVAHNAGMEFCGVIFTNVFGVGDKSNRSTNSIIKQLLRGEDLRSTDGKALYDWSYIDDVVGGLSAVGEKGIDGKEYYVGSSKLRPFGEIITDVRNILSPKSKIEFGAYRDTSYVDYTEMDIYELYRDTEYYPKCVFEESVQKTAQWLKTQMSEKSIGGGLNNPHDHMTFAAFRKAAAA